jgi:hypothetical protein
VAVIVLKLFERILRAFGPQPARLFLLTLTHCTPLRIIQHAAKMPHIGAVMERSLAEPQGFGEALRNLVARSVVAAMTKPTDKRGISDSITDVKTAFSSWDNCMQAVYCK